jgi:hypothetical protein
MRCDHCGATNPDAADWCNLCFADLSAARSDGPAAGHAGRREVEDGPHERTAGPLPGLGDGPGAVTAAAASTPRSDEARPEDDVVPGRTRLEPDEEEPREGFRRGDDGLEWQCPVCGAWAGMDVAACPGCGTPFRARLVADDPSVRPTPPPPTGRTVLLNALLPGLGHLVAGWPGSGLARLVLYCTWLIGGVGLLSAGGTMVAFPLLLGAFLLWLTAVHDGWQLGHAGPQILSGRMLLWLVVGVTVVAIMGVAGAAAVRTG